MIFYDSERDMIFVDPTERVLLEMKIPESYGFEMKPINGLEEVTGADIMISVEDIPCVPRLFREHLEAGAILVQRKSGMDLASSLGDRMDSSLGRMLGLPTKQAQRVLLFIGELRGDKNGNAIINGREVETYREGSYWPIVGALSKWGERGGVVEQISRIGLLPGWLMLKEKHLTQFKQEPIKTVYAAPPQLTTVDPKDVLQELRIIKDWRCTLATFPGLGPKRVEAIFEKMKEEGADMTLIQALIYITSFDTKIPGIGKATIKQCREWLGMLDDDAELRLSFEKIGEIA